MVVNVTLSITVDPEAWDEIYGRGAKSAQVREDVKNYVLNGVQALAGIDESGAEVTLKN